MKIKSILSFLFLFACFSAFAWSQNGYKIDLGDGLLGHAENITGLDTEVNGKAEADKTGGQAASTPGLPKSDAITFENASFENSRAMSAWLSGAYNPGSNKRDLLISLLDENNEAVKTWKLSSAYPIKMKGHSKGESGDELVERMEIVAKEVEVQEKDID